MDDELRDRVWASLPPEVRNEARELYMEPSIDAFSRGYDQALVHFFGEANLETEREGDTPRKGDGEKGE